MAVKIEMAEKEYDPKTCITAGELRAASIPIPPHIPDVAWVRKNSVFVDHTKCMLSLGDGFKPRLEGSFVLDFSIDFTEPFYWVKIDITIDKNGEKVDE